MISIVIPFFNEAENIQRVFERIREVGATWGEEYEVIAADDGSTDETVSQLGKIHQEDPRWKVLSLSRNFGHQTAISAGMHYAIGDAVVIMDGDLQDPPELIARLLEEWRKGTQVVYAVREMRKESHWLRFCYAIFYRLLHRISSPRIPLDSGDFCLLDKRVVKVLRTMPERCRFVRGMRSWVGFRQVGVRFERDARIGGKPKYTLAKLFRLAFDGLFSFSYVPLRAVSWLGFWVSLFFCFSFCF